VKLTLKKRGVQRKTIVKIRILEKKRILIIEPYYGGSHRQFLEGLQKNVTAEYILLTLPARKWKMRMQLSALWFVEEIKNMAAEKRWFDTILCSTFVDVAVLRVLLSGLDGWNLGTRFCTYFHENQFAYPGRIGDRQYHFPAINFTTALVSDRIAFNSSYNLETFNENCRKYLRKSADMDLSRVMDEIRRKSIVLYPGVDFSDLDTYHSKNNQSIPVIVWNHRWEHDKNPGEFFSALYALQERNIPFRLIVLGQSFRVEPACFQQARLRLSKQILHFGYVESRIEYIQLLKMGDVVVSTALQEFFGISVLEAVRAGCRPLLPDRLSYPELFHRKFLYSEGELPERLTALLFERRRLGHNEHIEITKRYQWENCSEQYEKWLFSSSV
jgi:glycosyltransferase involved in cell wall biosynthesis